MSSAVQLTPVDVEVMTRALRNLIDNATKHAPAGSSIELRIAELTSGVELAVRDEGPGLRGADPRQLFEPFRKGDDAGRVQGSGLGLAIVDRAVRAHGGRVHARDRDGGGAEFRIVLPRSTEVR